MAKLHFSDEVSAFGGIKKARIKDKGKNACTIARKVFEVLAEEGIPSWYEAPEGERDLRCKDVCPFPLQFIVRNRMVGNLAMLLCQETGKIVASPLHEMRYLSEELCNPMINADYAAALGIASPEELSAMQQMTDRCNSVLKAFFHKAGIELVDMKLQFGKGPDGAILLCSSITPDTARLWDEQSGKPLDKDRFRQDLGEIASSYKEIADRI